jgi:hypothetical protein
MTELPAKPRLSRQRRREALLNSIAKLIGCTALVVTVAVVFYVIVVQIDKEGPRVDPTYIEDTLATNQNRSGAFSKYRNNRSVLPRPVSPVDETAPQTPSLTNTLPGPQAPEASIPRGIEDIDKKRLQIESTIKKFFTSKTVIEKAACSRDRARVTSLMEVYYQKHPLNSTTWHNLGWVLPMDEKGHRFAYAQTLFSDADPICVIIEESANGEILVDWESSVRYSELDWQEFLAKRPDHPTLFRVIASKPHQIPETATSAQANQEVIEIKHPAEQGTVYAYFNRDDPQFSSLIEQLKLGNWTNVPLTLRLCYPGPTSNARAVRIAGVEGKGWLILQHSRS